MGIYCQFISLAFFYIQVLRLKPEQAVKYINNNVYKSEQNHKKYMLHFSVEYVKHNLDESEWNHRERMFYLPAGS